MSSPVRVLAALILACGLVGCQAHAEPKAAPATTVATTSARPRPPAPLDKHTAAGAQATADAGLAAVPLPPGARSVPTAALSTIDLGGPQASTRADAVRTWIVPLSINAMYEWLAAHAPELVGGPHPPPEEDGKEFLSWNVTQALDKPETQLVLTSEGQHTSVLIDTLVLWTPEKAPLQTIPADVTTATFDFVRPVYEENSVNPSARPTHTRTYLKGAKVRRTLTPAEVAEVRSFINAEPTDVQDNPQMPSSCAPGYESAALTFHYGGATEVFDIDLQGCGRIEPTINGVPTPYTSGGNDFAPTLRKLAGLAPGDPRGQPT